MSRLLKVEFEYNKFLLLALILITPLISLYQNLGSSEEMAFLVPMIGFLVVNGIVANMGIEKRDTCLSLLPVTPADAAIVRALIILIPFLSVIILHIFLGIIFGRTSYSNYEAEMIITGWYLILYFLILIIRDLFLSSLIRSKGLKRLKIVVYSGLFLIVFGVLVFLKMYEGDFGSSVFVGFLKNVGGKITSPEGVITSFLVSGILVYLSVTSYVRRKVYISNSSCATIY